MNHNTENQNTQKILITGGVGYIGSTISSVLSDFGYTPIILDSTKNNLKDFQNKHILFQGDFSDEDTLKTIFEIHHDLSSEGRIVRFIFKTFKVFNSKKILKVVAISKNVKNYLIDDLGTIEKKIHVLPSATGLQNKSWKGTIIKSKKNLNIGYFGSLEKTKGIDFLINLSKLDKKNNYYIFGGTNNNINTLKKKIFHRNLNLQSHVPYNKLQNCLSKMDILVMPYDKNTIRSAGGIGNISKYMSPLKLFDYLKNF